MSGAPHFRTGGVLREGDFYVARATEEDAFRRLCDDEVVVIVGPRQVGKSSLGRRLQRRFNARQNSKSSWVDLSSIGGGGSSEEQWYASLIRSIDRELGLRTDLDDFLKRGLPETPPDSFTWYVCDVARASTEGRLALFFDEIDVTLSLQDEQRSRFWGVFRSACQLNDLTACIIGVVQPARLIKNVERAPFTVGRAFRLSDLKREDLETADLSCFGAERDEVLTETLRWTDGHPCMTQTIFAEFLRPPRGGESVAERIDRIVRATYLERGRLDDHLLSSTAKYFEASTRRASTEERDDADSREMLSIYRKIRGGAQVPFDGSTWAHYKLVTTGIVKESTEAGMPTLVVRNLVYKTVFDDRWIDDVLRSGNRAFSERLAEWITHGRKADWLLGAAALKAANEWAQPRTDLDADELEYLRKSNSAASRRALAQAGFAMLVAVTLLSTGGYGWWRTRETHKTNEDTARRVDLELRTAHGEPVEQLRQRVSRAVTQANDSMQSSPCREDRCRAEFAARRILSTAFDDLSQRYEDRSLAFNVSRLANDRYRRELATTTSERDLCRGELATTTSARDQCRGELATTQRSLATALRSTAEATSARDQCRGELATTTSARDQCRGELETTQRSLTTALRSAAEATSARDQCRGELTRCEARLANPPSERAPSPRDSEQRHPLVDASP